MHLNLIVMNGQEYQIKVLRKLKFLIVLSILSLIFYSGNILANTWSQVITDPENNVCRMDIESP